MFQIFPLIWSWFCAMVGIAPQNGQILHILPARAASLFVKGHVIPKSSGKVNGTTSTTNGHSVKPEESISKFILDRCPSLRGTFKPSWWIRSGHLQTMYCVIGNFKIVDKVVYKRTLLRVPDGGTIAVDITPPQHEQLPEDAPTVIIAHGLTGGSHESYVRNILEWVARPKSEGGLGGRGVVANYRGCAGAPLTTQQAYSALYTGDYNTVVHYISNNYPASPLIGVGFSLGAGVLARYLGEQGDNCLLRAGVSLAPPWDIPAMSIQLEEGWFSSRVYSQAMGMNLTRTLGRHLAPEEFLTKEELASRPPTSVSASLLTPLQGLPEELVRLKRKGRHLRLRDFDDSLTCQLGGLTKDRGGVFPFTGADGYYAAASCKDHIHGIRRPLLAINAFDDPIVHGSALPVNEIQNSSHVVLAITKSGGHLGWFDGPLFNKRGKKGSKPERFPQQRWIIHPVSEFINAIVSELDASASYGKEHLTAHVESKEEGWHHVQGSEKQLYGPVSWKIVEDGGRIEGSTESGVLAGL